MGSSKLGRAAGRWSFVEGVVREDAIGRRRSWVVSGVAGWNVAATGCTGWRWWVEVVIVSATSTAAAAGKWRGRGGVVVTATGSGIGRRRRRRRRGRRRVAGVVAGGTHGAGDADGGWKVVALERSWRGRCREEGEGEEEEEG